jgi:hypothetical protein
MLLKFMANEQDISLRESEFRSLSPFIRIPFANVLWLIDEFRSRGYTDCDDETYKSVLNEINAGFRPKVKPETQVVSE